MNLCFLGEPPWVFIVGAFTLWGVGILGPTNRRLDDLSDGAIIGIIAALGVVVLTLLALLVVLLLQGGCAP